MANLRNGKYFGLEHEVEYLMYVIEYQKRKLPHGHVVTRLRGVPDVFSTMSIEEIAAWIDKHISAEFPSEVDSDYDELKELIAEHLIHKCAVGFCKETSEDRCKRRYDVRGVTDKTQVDEYGYPRYRRRAEKDLRVVPHNRKILLDWKAHINVEYAASAESVLYLYKYLYKGPKKVQVTIENNEVGGAEVQDENAKTDHTESAVMKKTRPDEIKLFLRARYLSAMEAMWQVLGYQTYPASEPPVITVKAKLEHQVEHCRKHNQVTDMLIYFCRPNALAEYKYQDLFRDYTWSRRLPKRFQKPDSASVIPVSSADLYVLKIPDISGDIYLYKRSKKGTIARLEMVYITAGSIWYLRLLLVHSSPRSFEDARTVDGTKYPTFQEAALRRGLISDQNECIVCYQQSVDMRPLSSELISLFVVMALEGYPVLPIYNDPELRDHMLRDYRNEHRNETEAVVLNWFHGELKKRFMLDGRSNFEYEIPEPEDWRQTEVDMHRARYDAEKQKLLLAELDTKYPNNAGQQAAFDAIMEAIENPTDQNRFQFVQGPGGSGKTILFKKLLAAVRARGLIALSCAATTIAALQFDHATSAHRLHNYPVIEDEEFDADSKPSCDIHEGTQRYDLFMETALVIYDEFVSNHRMLWEAIRNSPIFKNKNLVYVCGSDFRQILPVLKGNPLPEQVISATVSSSEYWKDFVIHKLTENMRLARLDASIDTSSSEEDRKWLERQKSYNDTICAVAEGRSSERVVFYFDEDEGRTQIIGLAGIKYFVDNSENQKAALRWVFPNLESQGFSSQTISEGIITCATNKQVDEWNVLIQEKNPAEIHCLKSDDRFCDVDDPHGYLQRNLNDILLNKFNANNVPPHELNLKVNDICILLRPVNAFELATNSRVRITAIHKYRIIVETVDEERKIGYIPRMRFRFNLDYGRSYHLLRTQFPLRLAYAITYNKSQSQTFTCRVLIDTTSQPFAHGHLYVALSRTRNCDNVALYVNNEDTHLNPFIFNAAKRRTTDEEDMAVVRNVVYKEVLL
jgi:PIF1-like helicase